jgi:serine/threonine protein kinase
LLVTPLPELGFVSSLPGDWKLLNGLGRGRFSAVFSCFQTSLPTQHNVIKIYDGSHDVLLMACREWGVLRELREAGIQHVPEPMELLREVPALIVTPIGVPVLPCPIHVRLTNSMFVTLLEVVRVAHRLGWGHRDIKPDNIYLDCGDLTKIVLNDWSSAARLGEVCQFVGTKYFGDRPDEENNHIPHQRLDLRSLVRTVYCLVHQRIQDVNVDEDGAIETFWCNVAQENFAFRQALTFADEMNYEELSKCFLSYL